jgi:outer membrane scaffolding protein for murein synthesis (MipA/OmpV family)
MIPLAALACAAPAAAQDEPRRTRIGLGVQVVPSYPGSDEVVFRPMVDVSRAKGEEVFAFEAPDESFGFPVVAAGGFEFGPAINLEGSRTAKDVGAALPKVGFTAEVGGFAQLWLSERFRLRTEARRGIGGHEAWIGNVGADYIARDADDWLFSVGPRATLASRRYQQAYFGVGPEASLDSGLPVFAADGGLMAVGVAAGYLRQLDPRWGVSLYAKYDRLVGDAADSPVTRRLGSADQFHGGVALTYTFGRRAAD